VRLKQFLKEAKQRIQAEHVQAVARLRKESAEICQDDRSQGFAAELMP
jgi:hypothetical protein